MFANNRSHDAVKGRFKSLFKLGSINLGQQNSFPIQAVIQSKRMDSFPNPDKLNDKLIGCGFFFQRLHLNLKRHTLKLNYCKKVFFSSSIYLPETV